MEDHQQKPDEVDAEASASAPEQETSPEEPEAETAGEAAVPEEDGEQTGKPLVEVDTLIAERDEIQDRLLRTLAEFDNYRKRVARDAELIRKAATESLMSDLLPVVDNLERALDHKDNDSGALADGVEMVLKQMLEVLARNGLERIPAEGEKFDPNLHEGMVRMPSEEHAPDHVATELQKGYKLGGRMLRPAKVGVSSGPPEPTE